MTDKEKADVKDLISVATQIPKDKREFVLGYMQCMVDMNDRRETKRRKNTEAAV